MAPRLLVVLAEDEAVKPTREYTSILGSEMVYISWKDRLRLLLGKRIYTGRHLISLAHIERFSDAYVAAMDKCMIDSMKNVPVNKP